MDTAQLANYIDSALGLHADLSNKVKKYAESKLNENPADYTASYLLGKALAECKMFQAAIKYYIMAANLSAGKILDERSQFKKEINTILEEIKTFFPHTKDITSEINLSNLNHGISYQPFYVGHPINKAFPLSTFFETTNLEISKLIFSDCVDYIELETSSQCNRVCHYCPNALTDRRSKNIEMDDEVFSQIIHELKTINYNKNINFSGYNEPLISNKIKQRIELTRKTLPQAKLWIHTNGDFLTKSGVDELRDAGLNNLIISIHHQPGKPYSEPEIKKRLKKMALRLESSLEIEEHVEGEFVSAKIPYNGLNIKMSQKNYDKQGQDRGALIKSLIKPEYRRTSACTLPINMFTIHYNGNVMPCCFLVGDNINHQKYTVGKITKNTSIFTIYTSLKYSSWKKALFSTRAKNDPCSHCTRDNDHPCLNNNGTIGEITERIEIHSTEFLRRESQ